MTKQHGWTPVVTLLVVAAATALWSCGGPVEGPTSPVALQESSAPAAAVPGQGDDGGVTASGADKITICHKGKSMQVSASALGGHVGHGDGVRPCAPAPDVACPCFTSTGIAEVAAQCSPATTTACGEKYSLNLYCSNSNLGGFTALVANNSCSTSSWDSTGNYTTNAQPVTPAQLEACRQAIVGSSFYPASCPR